MERANSMNIGNIKLRKDQYIIFIVGILLFLFSLYFGYAKLHYGFTFMDEGYHMTESWRLSANDHFIEDTPTGNLRNYRLINKLIFDIYPDITLRISENSSFY